MRRILSLLVIGSLLCSPVFSYGTNGCDSSTSYLSHFDTNTFFDEDCRGRGKLTVTNTGSVASTATNARFFNGAQFDGTTKYITIANSSTALPFSGDFSIECVISTTDASADTQFREIWNNGDASSANATWMGLALNNATGGLYFITADTLQITGTVNVADGAKHHVRIDRSGTDIALYVDGVKDGASFTSSTNYTISTGSFFIGIYGPTSTTGRFNGTIDEFRISSVSRRQNLSVPTTPYCSGCEMMEVIQ